LKTTVPLKISRSDLEGKSHQELLELVKQAKKLETAQRFKRLEYYLERAHAGQLQFHAARERIRLVLTGNRWGKSTAGMAELIWMNTGTHPFRPSPVPIKSVVVLPDFENHGKNIFEPKINQWVPEGAIKKIERHQGGAIKKIFWVSGSTTDVLSHDQTLTTFEGFDGSLAWFDEPPPEKIWKAVWRGMTDHGGIMYLTGTPLNCPWLFAKYKQIEAKNDPLYWYITGNSYENAKNLGNGNEAAGKKRLKEFEAELSDEEKRARIDGGFVQMEGQVFKEWSQAAHMLNPFPIPPRWPIVESIDPHPNKPWALSYITIAPNGSKILIHSQYCEGTIDDVANEVLIARANLSIEDGLKPRIIRTLIDNASSVPLWQKSNHDLTARRVSVKDELEHMIGPKAGGPRIECAPKNVAQKIDILKRWLHLKEKRGQRRPDFYVFDTQSNRDGFVWEIERYVWARFTSRERDEFKTQPVKKHDDILDSVMQVALTYGSGDTVSSGEVVDFTGGFSGYGQHATGVKTRQEFAGETG
jgi:hypothetical protein